MLILENSENKKSHTFLKIIEVYEGTDAEIAVHIAGGYHVIDKRIKEKPLEKPKICTTCKYVLGKRHNTEDADKWRCGHPENIKGINAVTGLKVYKISSCYKDVSNPEINVCESKGWEEYKPEAEVPQWTAINMANIGDVAAKKVAEAKAAKRPRLGNLDDLKL